MAAQPPPGAGDAADSRDQVDGEESMDVELALGAPALLSKWEEGEVHSESESHPDVSMQELFSSNAAAEGSTGSIVQARGVAATTVEMWWRCAGLGGSNRHRAHCFPLVGGEGCCTEQCQ